MKILLISLILLLPATTLNNLEAPPTAKPKDLLRDIICSEETAGHPVPEWAVNRFLTAWGECQIKYPSAVLYSSFDLEMQISGRPSRSPGDLFSSITSRKIAGEILNFCREKDNFATGRELAYCYCAGPNSEPYTNDECRRYAKRVGAEYATAKFHRDFRERSIQEADFQEAETTGL